MIKTAGGALAAGLLAPRIARAATFTLLGHATSWGSYSNATLDSTGADFLVVAVAGYKSYEGFIDAKGNAWVLALSVVDDVTPNYLKIWYSAAPASVGAGHSVYNQDTTGYVSIFFAAFSGALLTSPQDASTSQNYSAGSTVSSGSITPSQSNELVIAAAVCRYSPTAPTCSGVTMLDSQSRNGYNSWAGGLAYQIQTGPAAVNPSWTFSYNDAVAGTVAFKSTSSASGGGKRRIIVTGGE
jgi:hypothetical protein